MQVCATVQGLTHGFRSVAVNVPSPDRVVVECMYPLSGLHRLFSIYRFESDTVGVGHITTSPSLTGTVNQSITHCLTLLVIRWNIASFDFLCFRSWNQHHEADSHSYSHHTSNKTNQKTCRFSARLPPPCSLRQSFTLQILRKSEKR